MGLPRSTSYDAPRVNAGDAEIVAGMQAIPDELETYGYRRVGAALCQQGILVNGKKVRRLIREHDLQPRHRRRDVATTDSAHDSPVLPNLAQAGTGATGPHGDPDVIPRTRRPPLGTGRGSASPNIVT